MADTKSTLEQMLEHLVNDDTAKAEELFHDYVVAKSREVYENLIEEEMEDEEVEEASKDEESEEDKVDEASEESEDEKVDEASEDEAVEEEFEEVAVEGDDEEGEMDAMGGDATDDLAGEIEDGEDKGEKEPEELFQDLDSIVDELQAKFDELKGGEDAGEAMPDEDEAKEAIAAAIAPEVDELQTMREYVEKVAGGHGAEKKGSAEASDNKSSVVAGKNDMGGTAANIVAGGEAKEKNDGGLSEIKPKDIDSSNVNVPGAKKAAELSAVKGGHGAEKAGAKEQADNKQSIFRSKR